MTLFRNFDIRFWGTQARKRFIIKIKTLNFNTHFDECSIFNLNMLEFSCLSRSGILQLLIVYSLYLRFEFSDLSITPNLQ